MQGTSCAAAFALILAAGAAFGQSVPPTFEVASIKPTAPLDSDKIDREGLYIGTIVDKARVEIRNTSLAELIRLAYRLKRFQVTGPEWISTERFDVVAKLPEGGSAAQVPDMLRALLADRFQLVLHHESREGNIYALIVAKGGPKLTVSAPPGEAPDPLAATRAETGVDNKGAFVSSGPAGSIKLVPGSSSGGRRLELGHVTMASFAETLARAVDRPVIDQTGLTAAYDISLVIPRESLVAMARSAGIAMDPPDPRDSGLASDPASPTVFSSVQALGLKLESRKAPVDIVVVDSVLRRPTDN